MEETEVKVCKCCERELPLKEFRHTKWGGIVDVCNDCIKSKISETREANRRKAFPQPQAHYAEFDGKQPVEVIQLMKRAKMWLEERGYDITLKGSVTIKKNIKF